LSDACELLGQGPLTKGQISGGGEFQCQQLLNRHSGCVTGSTNAEDVALRAIKESATAIFAAIRLKIKVTIRAVAIWTIVALLVI
jgi:hypothetical protein